MASIPLDSVVVPQQTDAGVTEARAVRVVRAAPPPSTVDGTASEGELVDSVSGFGLDAGDGVGVGAGNDTDLYLTDEDGEGHSSFSGTVSDKDMSNVTPASDKQRRTTDATATTAAKATSAGRDDHKRSSKLEGGHGRGQKQKQMQVQRRPADIEIHASPPLAPRARAKRAHTSRDNATRRTTVSAAKLPGSSSQTNGGIDGIDGFGGNKGVSLPRSARRADKGRGGRRRKRADVAILPAIRESSESFDDDGDRDSDGQRHGRSSGKQSSGGVLTTSRDRRQTRLVNGNVRAR